MSVPANLKPQKIRTFVMSGVATFTLALSTPSRVEAYPIDCAILICLAGGWPSSPECSLARATFIRRITPFPIEPPLQIWRCPMGAAYTVDPEKLPLNRGYEIRVDIGDSSSQKLPTVPFAEDIPKPQPAVQRMSGGTAGRLRENAMLHLIQQLGDENGTADIDIGNADFDFVRSIRVYNIKIRDYRNSEGCERSAGVSLGNYGTQGDFSWYPSSRGAIPAAFGPTSASCGFSARAVFVDWRDYEGNYGFERVNY